MNVSLEIRNFLIGETSIIAFRNMCDESPAIYDFLQKLADEAMRTRGLDPEKMRSRASEQTDHSGSIDGRRSPGYFHRSVREYLTEGTATTSTNVRTADGAWIFYSRVHELFALCDPTVPCCQTYKEAYEFTQKAIPRIYRSGQSERYIQDHIIPRIPDTLPRRKRIRAIRVAIKKEFKAERYVHRSHPDWPMGKDGKPTTFIGREKRLGQDEFVFFFRDENDGTIIPVEE